MFGISDDKQDDENQDIRHEHSGGANETLEHDSSSPAYKISSPSSAQDDYSAAASDNDSDSTDNVPAEDSMASNDSPASDTNELFQLKQKTLQKLAPLVSHLEQSPEEKFKTTMMLIQASDNADLLEEAYAAANEITDEKTRAQALLDVVNEINYFTQKPSH